MKIGINTLWLKHKKVGGIESYLFNLLDGIFNIDKTNKYLLIISQENEKLFKKYLKYENIEIKICIIDSNKIIKRILLENFIIDKIAKNKKVDLMFNPVYSKPIFTFSKIPYVTTIHDLQAIHYPEYFSKLKLLWLKFAWKNAINTSSKIIAISDFVRDDIIDKFNVKPDKVCTIYNPIKIENCEDKFSVLSKRYNIEKDNYYYTVSSMYKHKNLITLLEVIKKLKVENRNINRKLVISGISGNGESDFRNKIKELGIEDCVIITGFIEDCDRNNLYKNCKLFLFPSIFEGFGMPPIEAMLLNKKVLTTDKTSIKEVTKGLATYVEDPFNVDEWILKIMECEKLENKNYNIQDYHINLIATQYVKVFEEEYKKRGY